MDHTKSALLVIDMQNDFMTGGALAVTNAEELIMPINNLMRRDWGLVVASKDWHPSDHISFASSHPGRTLFEEIVLPNVSRQVLWPDHCVQNSFGAELHTAIDQSLINNYILKGQYLQVDSYSAFFDNNHSNKTELDSLLKANGITGIYVVGLAGDYCVKSTALDGKKLGYQTYFVADATRMVNPSLATLLYDELSAAEVSMVRIAAID